MADTKKTNPKIKREGEQPVTQIEEDIIKYCDDLEKAIPDLKVLKDLHITSAREVNLPSGKSAIILTVPFRELSTYQKIQEKLVRELEKKIGKHLVVIGQRKILKAPSKNNHIKMQKRPNSRTLTAVHEAILEDMVFPADIVGKRMRYKTDGGKILKVFIGDNQKGNAEYKLETYSALYKDITGKEAVFKFPPSRQNLSISGKDLTHK